MPIDKTKDKVSQVFAGVSDLKQEPGELKRYNIFLPENDVERLEEHFRNLGMNKSVGIRMILRKYIMEYRL